MDAPTLRLSDDDLRHAVGDVDAVQAVAASLIAESTGRADWTPPAVGRSPDGQAEFDCPDTGQRCTMSAAGLRAFRHAVLTALATRHLLAPGVVTASVIGSGAALDLKLAALRGLVPDVSHVAVAGSPGRAVLESLDRDGIGLSLVDSPADAVFGANLVVLAGSARLDAPRLAKGALLVNTTGVDLPAALLDGVHEVYVDDRAALADVDRRLTRTPPAGRRGRTAGDGAAVGDWAVAADLGQVLAGDHPGRTDHDHVLLVELIGGGARVEAVLAGYIHQAARAGGLGTPTHS